MVEESLSGIQAEAERRPAVRAPAAWRAVGTIVVIAVFILTLALAAANGANDVPKGVATLIGARVASYRAAIAWGMLTTLAGGLLSLALAASLTKLFSKGIVTARPSDAFAFAVLAGAVMWVAVATATHMTVSTTHAIVGALIGAGLAFAPHAVAWGNLPTKIVIPLLASVAVSYASSALLNRLPNAPVPECICAEISAATPAIAGSTATATLAATTAVPVPTVRLHTGTIAECGIHGRGTRRIGLNLSTAHWLSAGLASFTRGLNDTPKIVAIGAFALPSGLTTHSLLLAVATAMAIGSLTVGARVARRLAEDVVQMSTSEAFRANLTTAVLVGVGANQGLPMSTTHVSTGAIAGIAGTKPKRLNGPTLRDFALAWIATPLTAGATAAAIYVLVS